MHKICCSSASRLRFQSNSIRWESFLGAKHREQQSRQAISFRRETILDKLSGPTRASAQASPPFFDVIRIIPNLLVCPCALMVTSQHG